MKVPAIALALCSLLPFQSAHAELTEASKNLDSVRSKYVDSAKRSEADIRGFIAGGGSCGFIGGIMVGKMETSEKDQAKSRQEIDKLLSAVVAGDASKTGAAKARIDAELVSLKDSRQQVEANLGTIKNALSTDSPSCKAANKAFFDIQTQNKVMTDSLSAARQILTGKSAEMSEDADFDTAYLAPIKAEEVQQETI